MPSLNPSSLSASEEQPPALDPSELGTKEYWEDHYLAETGGSEQDGNEEVSLSDPLELEAWFDDVNAPTKILNFLTSALFPLSPNRICSETGGQRGSSHASVLDLGTGNGSSLLTLRLQGSYHGYMVGVDYSSRSIELARKLRRQYDHSVCTAGRPLEPPKDGNACDEILFEVLDLLNDDPKTQPWWTSAIANSSLDPAGFDLVLDKGTFDAISLSSDTISIGGRVVRVHEAYPRIAISLLRPQGFLLVTSCNWTEEEVIRWFTTGEAIAGELDVFDKIAYPVFEFGGQKGQGVATVCFRRRNHA